MRKRAILFAALALSALQMAQADVITQYDRATFASALAGGMISGQNFDGLASGTILTTLDGVTYSASLGSPIVTNHFLTTTPPNGEGSTSEIPFPYFQGNETATFAFASSITAFGIDINTSAPTPGDFEAVLNDGAIAVSNFDVFPGNATGQFIGFTDSVPFTSVTIESLPDPGDGLEYSYTLDSLVYGNAGAITPTATPEPASLSFVITSFLLPSWFFLKRPKKV